MRPRIPERYALAQVGLRACAVLLSVITLAFLLYCTVRYRQTLGIGYASATWCVIFNAVETAALTDRSRAVPRLPPSVIVAVELLTSALCVVASSLMALQDTGAQWSEGSAYEGYVADPWRMYSVYLQGAVAALHGLFAVFACIDCCFVRRQRLQDIHDAQGLEA